MLKLKNVCKYYKIGKKRQVILDNINLDFRKNELVFILGQSGSGKSTLLNIISGNLKCDSGTLWYNGLCINDLSQGELDNYRRNIIGNIFQDYNLIDYMSVWDNIMLGYSGKFSKDKIVNLLNSLGIGNKKKQIVNKLSGGEKQRVAIARALVNNPDIILADEPTGALDSKNGIEVMEILKKISRDKLVIVVSHDNILASKYASRVINIKDGKCECLPILDNKIITSEIKKSKIKLSSIIRLAIKNIWLKKMRTLVTSLAISLGIVTMFVVVNLYGNFNKEINILEKDIVSVFPITIDNGEYELLNETTQTKLNDETIRTNDNHNIHKNIITNRYLEYLNDIGNIKYMTYEYNMFMPVITDNYKLINKQYLKVIPDQKYIDDNYDILYGKNISNMNEVLLKVDSNNNISSELLNCFGRDIDISYQEVIGKKLKVIVNDLYYNKVGNYYVYNDDYEYLYNTSDIELIVVGIIRDRGDNYDSFIYYNKDILQLVRKRNNESRIVKDQINSDYNVLGINMSNDDMLSYIGYDSLPSKVDIYVDTIGSKERVVTKLDEYNQHNDKVIYVDTMASAVDILKKFIMIIGAILIMFSAVAIIISSLMVGILTNVRVLERKKEIGILRSLGASRRDIRKLFNVENSIIGLVAILISIVIIYMIKTPIENIIFKFLDISNIFKVNYELFLIVAVLNILIIRICGSIPARKASKLEIVNCIYNRN